MVEQEKTPIKTENTDNIDWSLLDSAVKASTEFTEEKLRKALVFDPKNITRKAKGIKEVYDADLGTIRYTYLTYDELMEIGEMQDPTTKQPINNKERSLQILLKQLKTAYPTLSIDELRIWPFEAVTKLLMKLQGEGSFFYRKPQATPQTSKP
jgi:hypothetical protein